VRDRGIGLIERSWFEYALERRNDMQTWWGEFSECFQGVAGRSEHSGLDIKRGCGPDSAFPHFAGSAKDGATAFTATVTGGGPGTGSVQFGIDGAPSGSPVALNNGTAQFVTSFAIGGNHSVTATYSGDASHYGSSGVAVVNIPYTTGTLPGTYNITVTASSGALAQSIPLTLTVD